MDGHQIEEALGWASDGWTLARAQEELGKLRVAKRTGDGPATLRAMAETKRRAERERAEDEAARERQEKTMTELWDRYRKDVVAVANKPRTAAEKTRMWDRRIAPAVGALKVKDVTEEDVGAVVRAPLRLDSSGRIVGGKAEAGNLYRLLHHLFRNALAWRLRPKELGNPLDNVSEPKVSRRERLLTGGEVGALLRALDSVAPGGAKGSPTGRQPIRAEALQVVAVLRAAIFTGARISELLNLRWEQVRRDDMELHLPDTKSGFSRRPMSRETLAVLDRVERLPGVPFVFRSLKDGRSPLAYNTVEKAFRRIAAKAGVADCTLHTIRHWVATMTANTVSNARIGMAITGHKSHSAYMNYVHGDKDQAKALAEQLGRLADGLARAEPNVEGMPKRYTA
jgi:integrase